MDAHTFREGVRAFREAHHLDYDGLAKIIGCSASRIRQIEMGLIPTVELAAKVAMACEMDVEEMVYWVLTERLETKKSEKLRVGYGLRYTSLIYRRLRDGRTRVWIAGLTSIRKVRLPREGLKELVANGGQLRVALLDPSSDSFIKRRADESIGDGEHIVEERGLMTLRMDYECRAVLEVLKGLRSYSQNVGRGGVVEARLYDLYPVPASLAIVDRSMAYRYYYRPGHQGERKPAVVAWTDQDPLFREIENEFKDLWAKGKNVALDDFSDVSFTLPPIKLAK